MKPKFRLQNFLQTTKQDWTTLVRNHNQRTDADYLPSDEDLEDEK